jgi:uncharacterized protein YbjT (DUF2867 family)
MKPKIVVIGGSHLSGSNKVENLIGSKVVEKLTRKGHDAVATAPETGVNAITGEGLDEALAGAEVVIDVANSPSQPMMDFFQIAGENLAVAEVADAMDFFQRAAENLAAAEVTAGVKHHLALSVVGTERLQDSAYFRERLIQENLIKGSRIAYTLIRATHFYEFIRDIAQFGTHGDTVRVPHSLFQPIAAEDVATALADAALEAPTNGTIEIAGPDVFYIDELVAKVLEYDKDPRNVLLDDPGALYYGVKVDDQSLMPGDNPRLGSTRFDWWLAHNP